MAHSRPRLALFIDRQNVYHGARDTFGFSRAFHSKGQVNPLKVGELIAARVVDDTDRRLVAVRIYRGLPDARKSPKGNAAAMRQKSAWEKLDPRVTVISRPLRYPRDWPNSPEHEKGIDVQLAIDFFAGYIREEFEVGVLFSGDTDLLPALEAANQLAESEYSAVLSPEVAAWGSRSRSSGRRLRPKHLELHCHWLGELDFKRVEDTADYNIRP